MSYLIDTNVISELTRLQPNVNVQKWFANVSIDSLYISVLTVGEIRKGIEKLTSGTRKQKLTFWLDETLLNWFQERILPIDTKIAEKWGVIQAQATRSLPTIDSLLAATALHHDLVLVTRNESDFEYPLLQVINPWII